AIKDGTRPWPRARPVRMVRAMRRITLGVILQPVRGLPPGPELEDWERKVERVLIYTRPHRYSIAILPLVPVKLLAGSRWFPYFRQMRALDDALYAFIARKRKGERGGGTSVVADLLTATHDDGQPMSDAEIRDVIVTIITAGHETTSMALAWALE